MVKIFARKAWLWLILLILTLTAAVYILIPSRLDITCVSFLVCNAKSASRALSQTTTWAQVKPGYRGPVRQELPLYITLPWSSGRRSYPTALILIPKAGDSLALTWSCHIRTSVNPVRRLIRYYRARSLKDSMELVLKSLGTWLGREENIYNVQIKQIISTDSSLVFIEESLTAEPTVPDTYALIRRLRDYIRKNGANETNPPMRHVIRKPDGTFELMVAVPTDRDLPGGGDIQYKRFVPWRTLVATISGGPASVRRAARALQAYIQDHDRVSMAIPFESLVTDRERQPDTTQWITQVCQPVF